MNAIIPPALQVIPPGLLGFFQLKSGGKNPSALGEDLSPVLECFRWYMQARLENSLQFIGFSAIAVNVVGAFNFSPNNILVPENEIWWVENFTVQSAALAAGEELMMVPMMLGPPQLGSISNYALGTTAFVANAGDRYSIPATPPGFFAPPGSSLGFFVNRIVTAGNITISGFARVARCKI